MYGPAAQVPAEAPLKDFRKLRVWEKSHQLVLSVYKVTAALPADERFGIASQMRRAAVSIPANIAEGCGRGGDREFARFLRVAAGSAAELEYLILLALDLDLVAAERVEPLAAHVVEVRKMLRGLVQTIQSREHGDSDT